MDDLEKARAAQRVLDDQLFTEIRADLHARYLEEWKQGLTPDARDMAWHRERALTELEEELRRALSGGIVATTRQARADARHARRTGESR